MSSMRLGRLRGANQFLCPKRAFMMACCISSRSRSAWIQLGQRGRMRRQWKQAYLVVGKWVRYTRVSTRARARVGMRVAAYRRPCNDGRFCHTGGHSPICWASGSVFRCANVSSRSRRGQRGQRTTQSLQCHRTGDQTTSTRQHPRLRGPAAAGRRWGRTSASRVEWVKSVRSVALDSGRRVSRRRRSAAVMVVLGRAGGRAGRQAGSTAGGFRLVESSRVESRRRRRRRRRRRNPAGWEVRSQGQGLGGGQPGGRRRTGTGSGETAEKDP